MRDPGEDRASPPGGNGSHTCWERPWREGKHLVSLRLSQKPLHDMEQLQRVWGISGLGNFRATFLSHGPCSVWTIPVETGKWAPQINVIMLEPKHLHSFPEKKGKHVYFLVWAWCGGAWRPKLSQRHKVEEALAVKEGPWQKKTTGTTSLCSKHILTWLTRPGSVMSQ